jgi:hypothetical protein
MTIAAALAYDGGVLLCAETQMEAGALKIHAPKVGSFECPGGRLGFAMAGNANFAISAIQKCSNKLKNGPPNEIIQKLESALESEYRRVVFGHPNYKTDWTLAYWFLIAFWSSSDNKVWLFATEENTLRSANAVYECIGIGKDLAHYLLATPSTTPKMNEQRAVLLAAYMLARVKDHVPGCGGASHILLLRNDGSFDLIDPFAFDLIARQSGIYEWGARELLFAAIDNNVTDEQFEQHISIFSANARHIRRSWQQNQAKDPLFSAMWKEFSNKINSVRIPPTSQADSAEQKR